jgi:hypothetical protein
MAALPALPSIDEIDTLQGALDLLRQEMLGTPGAARAQTNRWDRSIGQLIACAISFSFDLGAYSK